MAIRLVGTELAYRTTGLVAATDLYTGICWFKPSANFATRVNVFRYFDAGFTAWAGVVSDTVPNEYNVGVNNGVTNNSTANRALTAGTWYPVVYKRNGTLHTFTIGNTNIGSVVNDISAVTFTSLILGYDGSSDPSGDFAYFREWNDLLTNEQIQNEFSSPTVIRTANLITDTPLISDGLDLSGNGNNWTVPAFPTYVSGPAFFPNSIASGATVISSLPHVASYQAKIPGQEFIFNLWFKYTNAVANSTIGIFGFGDAVAFPNGYSPDLSMFSPDALTEVSGVFGYNVPAQVVLANVADYWIKFLPDTTFPAATLSLTIQNAPNSAIPVEALIINDDNNNYPMVIASSSVDYEILRIISPFVSGEQGDALNTSPPVYLFSAEGSGGGLRLYDENFAEITSVAGLTGFPSVRTCLGANKFYVGYATSQSFFTVDELGNASSPVNVGSGLRNLAANNDETILYHALGTANQPIKRWDIVNGVPLSDFLPGVVGEAALDILILDDDTIIIGYPNSIKRYNAAGTLLNTYSVLPTRQARLAYSRDNSASFWAWFRNDTTEIGTFQKIRVSDGVVLQDVDHDHFEFGNYQGNAAADNNPFGISFSCPFVVVAGASAPPLSSITVSKITNPNTDPAIFTFNAVGLDPVTFTLAHGESRTFDNLVPGTYSIIEVATEGYVTTYVVSNGDENDSITIIAGDAVTVVVTNTAFTASGIYKLVYGKRNDTLYTSTEPEATVDVKIPDPAGYTGYFGG